MEEANSNNSELLCVFDAWELPSPWNGEDELDVPLGSNDSRQAPRFHLLTTHLPYLSATALQLGNWEICLLLVLVRTACRSIKQRMLIWGHWPLSLYSDPIRTAFHLAVLAPATENMGLTSALSNWADVSKKNTMLTFAFWRCRKPGLHGWDSWDSLHVDGPMLVA